MATLNSAIQALVDNLHGKMTDNDPANRLTAEDQSLVTSAISKLSEHTSWELALVAVAEGQLIDAGQTLTDSVTPVIDSLNTAATDVTTAKDTLVGQTTNLAQLKQASDDVQAMLDNFTDASLAEFTNKVAGSPKTVFGVQPIETSGQGLENQRAPTAFSVYDSDGESYVVRPCYHTAGTETEWAKLETLKLRGDGGGKEVLGFHYVHFHTFDASPQTYVFQYGASAILPLAGKNDSEGMNYVRLFSTQSTASSAWADYAGIYVLHPGSNIGSESITKPKRLIGATDQWGIPTSTFHFWNDVGVLYDNMRHCVTMVDDTTGTLIQKYSDGNVDTQIAIADSAELQAYVDAGDFTVVKFINHLLQWPFGNRRSDTAEVAMAVSHESDCHGYYGKLGDTVRMGGSM
ncbi:MAG: hypothetical protein ACI8WB_003635, partial [Phenylobacterium sp.]